jgi:mono/diheme cytochrome c family protein
MQNWYAPSLTANQEAGLGDWPIADITALLKSGTSMRGAVYGPMAAVTHNSLQYLSDADVQAMAVYLKTLPERNESIDASVARGATTVAASVLSNGHAIYERDCASCHGSDGRGKPPAYPPLAANQSIQMESSVNATRMVLNGGYPPQTAGNPRPYGMPPFAQILSDADIAAVVTSVRAAPSSAGETVAMRQAATATLRNPSTRAPCLNSWRNFCRRNAANAAEGSKARYSMRGPQLALLQVISSICGPARPIGCCAAALIQQNSSLGLA